jgi:hypothetical protein
MAIKLIVHGSRTSTKPVDIVDCLYGTYALMLSSSIKRSDMHLYFWTLPSLGSAEWKAMALPKSFSKWLSYQVVVPARLALSLKAAVRGLEES